MKKSNWALIISRDQKTIVLRFIEK